MRSFAARAVENYRRASDQATRLILMATKADEFAPQVVLPGRLNGTVFRYQDGSMGFVDQYTGRAITLTKPELMAVCAEALRDSQGISTESWIRMLTYGKAPYRSQSICAGCGEYRPPISRDEQGNTRLGPCPNGCRTK